MQDFADQASSVAAACHDMAIRFHRGGKLVVFGTGGASTDAQHVAVEFVHPVIVGKRALPAISLTSDIATITGVAAQQGMTEIFEYALIRVVPRVERGEQKAAAALEPLRHHVGKLAPEALEVGHG